MIYPRLLGLALSLTLVVSACSSDENAFTDRPASASPALANAQGADGDAAQALSDRMDAVNLALAADGADYRVAMAEWIAAPGSDQAGSTILQKDVGNKQLSFDFVPGDARRAWSANGGNDITYAIDETADAVPVFGGLTAAQTDASIASAMSTWDGVSCSSFGLTRNPSFGIDIGIVAGVNGFAFADVQHAGFTDLDFAGGVLGVAFTFGFTAGPGVFTDIDNNGKADTALREIYYDPSWVWGNTGAAGTVDVESIALHEAGHGLSQAHFGNIRIKNNGQFTASPDAIMNAFYPGGARRTLRGSDNGGHCSNWGQWPNN